MIDLLVFPLFCVVLLLFSMVMYGLVIVMDVLWLLGCGLVKIGVAMGLVRR